LVDTIVQSTQKALVWFHRPQTRFAKKGAFHDLIDRFDALVEYTTPA
jgi:hypothetical protein